MKRVFVLFFAVILLISCSDQFDRNNPYDSNGTQFNNSEYTADDDNDGIENYFDPDSKYYRGGVDNSQSSSINSSSSSSSEYSYNLYSEYTEYFTNVNTQFVLDLQNDPYIDFDLYEIDYKIKNGSEIINQGVMYSTHFEYTFINGGYFTVDFQLIDHKTQNVQAQYTITINVKDNSSGDYDAPVFVYPNGKPDVAHVNVGDQTGFDYYFSRNNFISANDLQDGDVTSRIDIKTVADINVAGHYVIFYTVSDNAGNITKDSLLIDIDEVIASSSASTGNIEIYLNPVIYKLNDPAVVSLGDTITIPQTLVWANYENLTVNQNGIAVTDLNYSDVSCTVYKFNGSNFELYETNNLTNMKFPFTEGFYKVSYGYKDQYPQGEIFRYFKVVKASVLDDAEFTSGTTIFNILQQSPYSVTGLTSCDWYLDNSILGNSSYSYISDVKSINGFNTLKRFDMEGNLDVISVITVPVVDNGKSLYLPNLKGVSFVAQSSLETNMLVVLNFQKDIDANKDVYLRPFYQVYLTTIGKAYFIDISQFENINNYSTADYTLKSISLINDTGETYTVDIDNLSILGYDYQEVADILNGM